MSADATPEPAHSRDRETPDLTVDLSGAVSVVVGASVGIGQAIAVALAKSGSRVVAASRDRNRWLQAA